MRRGIFARSVKPASRRSAIRMESRQASEAGFTGEIPGGASRRAAAPPKAWKPAPMVRRQEWYNPFINNKIDKALRMRSRPPRKATDTAKKLLTGDSSRYTFSVATHKGRLQFFASREPILLLPASY